MKDKNEKTVIFGLNVTETVVLGIAVVASLYALYRIYYK